MKFACSYAAQVIVRCTGKTLRFLGARASEVPDGDDDWYLNLLWLDGRKCLLLTHATTLFPVFSPNVRKRDVADLGAWVTTQVQTALAAERLPPNALGELHDQAILGRTASRRILGHMNQAAFEIEHIVADEGGLQNADIDGLNAWLRRALRGADDKRSYSTPLELTKARLKTSHG